MTEKQEAGVGKAFWIGSIVVMPILSCFFYHLIDKVSPVYDIAIVCLITFVASIFVGFMIQGLAWIITGIRQGDLGWKHLLAVIILLVILIAGFYYIESLSEEKKTAVETFFKGIMNVVNLVILLVNLVLFIVSYLILRTMKREQNKITEPNGS